MLINLTDVLSREDKVVRVQAKFEAEHFQSKLGVFLVISKSPVFLTLTHGSKGKLQIEGVLDLLINIPCSRCAEDVKTDFHFEMERHVDMNMSEEERIQELDENNYITGYNLDVEKLVYSEILLNWPMKVLCSENCKGICSRCGANLNDVTCDCDTTSLDPRMAQIRDIFSKFKEV